MDTFRENRWSVYKNQVTRSSPFCSMPIIIHTRNVCFDIYHCNFSLKIVPVQVINVLLGFSIHCGKVAVAVTGEVIVVALHIHIYLRCKKY